MIQELVEETNQIRSELGPRTAFTDAAFLRGLAKKLKDTRTLYREPAVQCFIEDIESIEDTVRLPRTKAHINGKANHRIFSLFDASYFPALSLEFLAYRPLPVDENLAARYASKTTPVTIEQMSQGFTSRVVVALFPENHIDHVQNSDDLIFYFIDKFIERHQRITRKLLDNIVDESAFGLLRNASIADIEKASTHWVWLHEYHHHKGDMPLRQYLSLKSLKPLAGLEELRVDVSGMMVCLGDSGLKPRDAEMAYQFILAERLLRYSVEGIPKPNYDAVASQLLFNFLLENRGIELINGKLHLMPLLPEVLRDFLSRIHSIERTIYFLEPRKVQKKLLDFVNQYTVYDPELRDYQHIGFFADVKRRLNV
jgi:uncharacterized protein DUF6421